MPNEKLNPTHTNFISICKKKIIVTQLCPDGTHNIGGLFVYTIEWVKIESPRSPIEHDFYSFWQNISFVIVLVFVHENVTGPASRGPPMSQLNCG